MAKHYTVNRNTKTITRDYSVKATDKDIEEIQMYLNAGYIIRQKSQRRKAASAKKATKLTDADIQKALEGKPEELAEYLRIKTSKGTGGGFFAAKAYYTSLKKRK